MGDYNTILAAVDLSEEANEVATKAARFAAANQAKLHLIHVIEPLSFAYGGEIHALAEKLSADLIIVGSHGRHGLALLLGSTANGVLHGAKCDVLAMRVGKE